jgi:hypothetical protein
MSSLEPAGVTMAMPSSLAWSQLIAWAVSMTVLLDKLPKLAKALRIWGKVKTLRDAMASNSKQP